MQIRPVILSSFLPRTSVCLYRSLIAVGAEEEDFWGSDWPFGLAVLPHLGSCRQASCFQLPVLLG